MLMFVGTVLLVLGAANGSRRPPPAKDESIASLCAKLAASGSTSAKNARWEKFCAKWSSKPGKREMDGDNDDEEDNSNEDMEGKPAMSETPANVSVFSRAIHVQWLSKAQKCIQVIT